MGGDAQTGPGPAGMAALWVGFAAMSFSSLVFVRSAYSSRSKTNRVYHYITCLVTAIAAVAYLIMASNIMDDNARYLDYIASTPLLVIDLGFLSGMAVPEVAFLSVVDILMICCGFAAWQAPNNAHTQIWPLFALGACFFSIIVAALFRRLNKLAKSARASGTVEAKAYRFLSIFTISLWCLYPVVFILHKATSISSDALVICETIMDIAAKCVFGAVLVGSREALEGENTLSALLAMAVIGMDPTKRRGSMIDIDQPAIYAASKGSVEPGGAAGVSRLSNASDMDDTIIAMHADSSSRKMSCTAINTSAGVKSSARSVGSADTPAIAFLGSPVGAASKPNMLAGKDLRDGEVTMVQVKPPRVGSNSRTAVRARNGRKAARVAPSPSPTLPGSVPRSKRPAHPGVLTSDEDDEGDDVGAADDVDEESPVDEDEEEEVEDLRSSAAAASSERIAGQDDTVARAAAAKKAMKSSGHGSYTEMSSRTLASQRSGPAGRASSRASGGGARVAVTPMPPPADMSALMAMMATLTQTLQAQAAAAASRSSEPQPPTPAAVSTSVVDDSGGAPAACGSSTAAERLPTTDEELLAAAMASARN